MKRIFILLSLFLLCSTKLFCQDTKNNLFLHFEEILSLVNSSQEEAQASIESAILNGASDETIARFKKALRGRNIFKSETEYYTAFTELAGLLRLNDTKLYKEIKNKRKLSKNFAIVAQRCKIDFLQRVIERFRIHLYNSNGNSSAIIRALAELIVSSMDIKTFLQESNESPYKYSIGHLLNIAFLNMSFLAFEESGRTRIEHGVYAASQVITALLNSSMTTDLVVQLMSLLPTETLDMLLKNKYFRLEQSNSRIVCRAAEEYLSWRRDIRYYKMEEIVYIASQRSLDRVSHGTPRLFTLLPQLWLLREPQVINLLDGIEPVNKMLAKGKSLAEIEGMIVEARVRYLSAIEK